MRLSFNFLIEYCWAIFSFQSLHFFNFPNKNHLSYFCCLILLVRKYIKLVNSCQNMSKPSNIYYIPTTKKNEKWLLLLGTRLGNSNCCSWIIPHLSLLPLPYICCVWGSEVRKLLCTHFLELDQKRLMSLAQITTCPDHK